MCLPVCVCVCPSVPAPYPTGSKMQAFPPPPAVAPKLKKMSQPRMFLLSHAFAFQPFTALSGRFGFSSPKPLLAAAHAKLTFKATETSRVSSGASSHRPGAGEQAGVGPPAVFRTAGTHLAVGAACQRDLRTRLKMFSSPETHLF